MWTASSERKDCYKCSYIHWSGAHTVQFVMHAHAAARPVVFRSPLRTQGGECVFHSCFTVSLNRLTVSCKQLPPWLQIAALLCSECHAKHSSAYKQRTGSQPLFGSAK